MVQDAYSVFQDDGSGGGGGGMITDTFMQPEGGGGIVLQMLPPAGLNTAPPTLVPPEPIIPSAAAYPVPGNGVQSPPPGNIDTVPNIMTLSDTGPSPSPANPPADLPTDATMPPAPAPAPLPAPAKTSWLWILAALGGAYLLFKDSPKRAGVSGKGKKSMMVPLLVVGGAGALYLLNKKQQAAATTTVAPGTSPATTTTNTGTGGTPVPVDTDPNRTMLLAQYASQPTQLGTLQTADAETIRRWAAVVGMWSAGWPAEKIYSTSVDGVTPLCGGGMCANNSSQWNNSIGKWWENFSKQHNF